MEAVLEEVLVDIPQVWTILLRSRILTAIELLWRAVELSHLLVDLLQQVVDLLQQVEDLLLQAWDLGHTRILDRPLYTVGNIILIIYRFSFLNTNDKNLIFGILLTYFLRHMLVSHFFLSNPILIWLIRKWLDLIWFDQNIFPLNRIFLSLGLPSNS